MDEEVRAQILRVTGRVNAVEVFLGELAKTLPTGEIALRSAAESVTRLAQFLMDSGQESNGYIAMGMRECLQAMADSGT